MRKRNWAWVLVLMSACEDDDVVTPANFDRSLLDASARHTAVDADAAAYAPTTVDAAPLEPACPSFPVCTDNKPAVLYNVCISGAPSGAVSQPACLVDSNGVLYLAPLTSGQLVTSKGWTQSTNATLGAADQSRCETARTALLADASTPPKCAGGP